jgi:hypothetical protein
MNLYQCIDLFYTICLSVWCNVMFIMFVHIARGIYEQVHEGSDAQQLKES